jgi:hypothetical protein
MESTQLYITYQSVVELLGDALALMTRRERKAWSLHDSNILAMAKGRFKAAPHINHSWTQVGQSVRSPIGILSNGGIDGVSSFSGEKLN